MSEPLCFIFHADYYRADYAHDPAAAPGRLESIMRIVEARPGAYRVVSPEPAAEDDIRRAHGPAHIDEVRADGRLYRIALLAAGGAIRAGREAVAGNPAFACVRPPGHHASAASCWGFCWFNNVAVSLLALRAEGLIRSAFLLDFDLHTGDGNIDILRGAMAGFPVTILNPGARERGEYLREVERVMADLTDIDIVVASAGFDQGVDDWGGLLHTEDYRAIGRLMKEHALRLCGGRRYAVLEGGYNHDVLGGNVDAFCEGFR